jgi:hypothetical protein
VRAASRQSLPPSPQNPNRAGTSEYAARVFIKKNAARGQRR